jgi:F1F0 ATPase subunit 2
MTTVPVDVLVAIASGGLGGVLLGRIYFAHLRQSTERLVQRGPDLSFAGWAVVRLVGALAVFVLLMRWSPAAAVSGLVGFTLARHWTISQNRLR